MPKNRLEVVAAPDEPTFRTRRVVDAPRALVWEMFTKPEHVRRWMGPRALIWTVCEMDVRPGGAWRWRQKAPDGTEFGFHGVFQEVVAPEKIVWTFTFDPYPDAEAVETLTFTEHDGKTTVQTLSVHKSVANRDGHLAGGRAEIGMGEGYEKLDELVAAIAAKK